jgi:hypothetical protein
MVKGKQSIYSKNIMPNAIKYNTSAETLALKKGNFYIGTLDVGKGPTSSTGYINGITPPSVGYTIYTNPTGTFTSIFCANNDPELINFTRGFSGQNFTTVNDCLSWFASQSNYVCLNNNYPPVITNGLVLNLDASFTPSYPKNGTTWYDVSSDGNNGTLINGPTFSTDGGGTLVFDGTDDYVNIGVNKSCNRFTGDFAVSAWVNRENAGIQWGNIIGDYYTNGTQNNLEWQIMISNTAQLFVYNVTNGYVINPISSGFNVGTWINVVLSRIGSTLSLYANSNFITSVTNTTTFGSATGNLNIGIDGDNSSEALKGKIGNVLIYKNKGLSSTEVLQNFNAGLTRFNTTNTVKDSLSLCLDPAIYMSYPTSGTIWRDLSGYGNTATLINGPTFDSTSKGIVFDGTDDVASVGSSRFGIINQFTIEVVCKPTGFLVNGMFNFKGPNYDRGIMTHWPWVDGNGYFDIYNTAGGFHRWYGNISSFVNTIAIYHFILNSDGSMVVKRNGSTVTPTNSDTFSGVVNLGESNSIGAFYTNGSAAWPGVIYDFKVYNKALTQSEILQNYYLGNMVTSSLLVSLDAGNVISYPGSGNVWYDLSGNGNHFTLYNGVGYSADDGGCLTFDGSNDYASSASNINLTSYDYVVVEVFYKCNSTAAAMLFEHTSDWNSNTGGFGLATNVDGNNQLTNCNHTNHNTEVARNYLVNDNSVWNNNLNIYSRISDPTGRLTYVNGNLVNFTSVGGYPTGTGTSPNGSFANAIFYVGSRGGSNSFFNGRISSIKIYGFKMNSNQVQQNFYTYNFRFPNLS